MPNPFQREQQREADFIGSHYFYRCAQCLSGKHAPAGFFCENGYCECPECQDIGTGKTS